MKEVIKNEKSNILKIILDEILKFNYSKSKLILEENKFYVRKPGTLYTIINLLITSEEQKNIKFKVLMEAAINDYKEIIEILAEDIIDDVNFKDERGDTALKKAVERDHFDMVIPLMKLGSDVNAQDNWGRTILMHAVENGHEKIVQLLIDNGVKLNVQDDFGHTALTRALKNGSVLIAKLLIKAGIDINDGYTPALYRAVQNDYSDIIKILLKSPGIRTNNSNSNQNNIYQLIIKNFSLAKELVKDICENLDQYSDKFYKDENFIKMITLNINQVSVNNEHKLRCVEKAIELFREPLYIDFTDFTNSKFLTIDFTHNSILKELKVIKKQIQESINSNNKVQNVDKNVTFFSPDLSVNVSIKTRNIE